MLSRPAEPAEKSRVYREGSPFRWPSYGYERPAGAAGKLRGGGVEHVVVIPGERGALYRGPQRELQIDAPLVRAVDTVACGDAFNGALAAMLAGEADLRTVLRTACAAGAAAALRQGAYPLLPRATRWRPP